jgi:OmpA-OmpF porin, OOP family
MAVLDSLISEVNERYGLGGKASVLLSGLLSMISNEQTGGLSGFIEMFRRAGLGDMVSSWISRGANSSITTTQLESALGTDVINRLASRAGISGNNASLALAYMVPKVIDALTPDGVVPSRLPGWVSNYLTGTETPSRPVVNTYERTEPARSSIWRTLLPLLGLALLAFLGYRFCARAPEQGSAVMVTGTATPTATATLSAVATPIVRADLGAFIDKRLPNGVTLRIPTNGVESKLIAFIEDPTRRADKETWFSFDRLEFETDSATLRPSSQEQLRNIAEIMKAYPNVNAKIGGYTDNVGEDAYNMKLSTNRARNTEQEIVKLGVNDARLEAEGYGEQHPVADNATEEGRQRNRRIDIRVTKK